MVITLFTSVVVILFINAPTPLKSWKKPLGAAALMLLLLSVWFVSTPRRPSSPSDGTTPESTWRRTGMMADVMVSGIGIDPPVPDRSRPFSVSVVTQNRGIIESGLYTIRLVLAGPDRQTVLDTAITGNPPLESARTRAALSLPLAPLGKPGTYTLSVQLEPEGFDDEQPENNRSTRVFQVE
ncbi:MAG: hypothetical protein J7D60_10605 [Prosthecochloris sp.]|nr:hypothetical protein [Prosthecochloris sp.]